MTNAFRDGEPPHLSRADVGAAAAKPTQRSRVTISWPAAVLAAGLGLLCAVVSAQSTEQPQRFSVSQARQLSASPPTARAYLDIENAAGEPAKDLGQSRMSATIGPFVAALSPPRPFSAADEGVGTLFLVDVSRSLRQEEFLQIKGAIDSWLGRMGPRDRAALLSFGSSSSLLVDWTGDAAAVRAALESLGPTDDLTLLHQALADALELGGRKDVGLPGRRAIVVLSDGRDEGSSLALDDILATLRTNPTPIYTIGFVPQARTNRERDLDVLRRLGVNSGGSFFEASNSNLAEAYLEIEAAINNVWVTDVTCLECSADGGNYRLHIELATGGRVLSSGSQLRLLPQAGDSGRSSPPEQELAAERRPPALGEPSSEHATVSSWLFSPRTLLFFWLPLLLGLSLLAAALVQSRSEDRKSRVEEASRSSLGAMVSAERALVAGELYASKEDEPLRHEEESRSGDGSGSSSFSLSLPGAQSPYADGIGDPTSQFPLADLASKSEAKPLFGFEDDPLPLPSLRPDAQGETSGGTEPGASFKPSPSPMFNTSANEADVLGADLGGGSHRAHYTLAPRVVRFVVLRGRNKGKQFRALLRDRLVVGSRSTADLVIVGEVNVSAEQFQLTQDGSDILIRNLDTARPTLVNGHELEERQALQAGDLVGNGDVILRTVLGDG